VKTFIKKEKDIENNWLLADAAGKVLGRFASQVATRLTGKHKPDFSPHQDCGDHVVVVNAEKIQVTGRKADQKIYWHHTKHPGGQKEILYKDLMIKKPAEALENAILGMVKNKGPLSKRIQSKLHIYAGDQHPHQAQQPQPVKL